MNVLADYAAARPIEWPICKSPAPPCSGLVDQAASEARVVPDIHDQMSLALTGIMLAHFDTDGTLVESFPLSVMGCPAQWHGQPCFASRCSRSSFATAVRRDPECSRASSSISRRGCARVGEFLLRATSREPSSPLEYLSARKK